MQDSVKGSRLDDIAIQNLLDGLTLLVCGQARGSSLFLSHSFSLSLSLCVCVCVCVCVCCSRSLILIIVLKPWSMFFFFFVFFFLFFFCFFFCIVPGGSNNYYLVNVCFPVSKVTSWSPPLQSCSMCFLFSLSVRSFNIFVFNP